MGDAGSRRARALATYCMKLVHHDQVQRRPLTRLAAVLVIALAAAVASSLAMLPAQAACNVMTFQFDPTSGVVLSPSTLTVANGACVTFHNATITQAQFSVGHYKSNAPAFSDATPNYVAGPAGTHQTVTASGAAGNARGTIVAKPAPPKPSPSPTHSSS